jgi:hypothetical protein
MPFYKKLIVIKSLRLDTYAWFNTVRHACASTLSDVNTHERVYREMNLSTVNCICTRHCISRHVYKNSFVIHDIEHRVLLMSKSNVISSNLSTLITEKATNYHQHPPYTINTSCVNERRIIDHQCLLSFSFCSFLLILRQSGFWLFIRLF